MADNFNVSDTPEEAGPKSVELPGDIADGSEGELISFDALGVAAMTPKSGTPGFILTENAAGVPTFQAGGGGGGVTSFETRVGAVVSAVGDYSFAEISGTLSDAQHAARGGGTLHADVIASGADGFMTGADKAILDGIEPGAEVNDVDSVFTRVGAVVAAASDYDAGQVDNDSSIAGAFVDDALNNLDNAVAQAQRTTDFAIPTAFGDVTLDTTNVETNAAIVNHDLGTNDDNIIAVVAGTYEVHYQFSLGPTQDTNSVSIVEARCRVNDTTVIAGSELHVYVFEDNSIESELIGGFLSGTFVVALGAADFVTLQLNQIEQDGSPTPDALADTITLSMKRLTQ